MICIRYHAPNLRVCDTLQHRQSLPWVIKAIVTVGDFKVEIKLVLARVDLLQGLGEPSSLHQGHHLADVLNTQLHDRQHSLTLQ